MTTKDKLLTAMTVLTFAILASISAGVGYTAYEAKKFDNKMSIHLSQIGNAESLHQVKAMVETNVAYIKKVSQHFGHSSPMEGNPSEQTWDWWFTQKNLIQNDLNDTDSFREQSFRFTQKIVGLSCQKYLDPKISTATILNLQNDFNTIAGLNSANIEHGLIIRQKLQTLTDLQPSYIEMFPRALIGNILMGIVLIIPLVLSILILILWFKHS